MQSVKVLVKKAFPGQVLTLTGDLGVGKTVFTQGLAEGLGIEEPVNSPTFTIVQVYEEGRLPFYHFDVYRIGDIEEMDEVGFEEYVMGEGVSLIEWANLIEEILPERRTNILIEKDRHRDLIIVGSQSRNNNDKKLEEWNKERLLIQRTFLQQLTEEGSKTMRVLAIDSSGLTATVAVVEDEQTVAEYTVNYKKTHSQTLLPMIDEVKKMIDLDLSSIDAIAVSGGPGSLPGLESDLLLRKDWDLLLENL